MARVRNASRLPCQQHDQHRPRPHQPRHRRARNGFRPAVLSAARGHAGHRRDRGPGHARGLPDPRGRDPRAGTGPRSPRPRGRAVLRALRLSALATVGRRRASRDRSSVGAAVLPPSRRPDLAGLRGRGDAGDPAAPRGAGSGCAGLAGEPHAHAGFRAADTDRRSDPDVEPLGRDRVLCPAATHWFRAAAAACRSPRRTNPDAGGPGRAEPGLGVGRHLVARGRRCGDQELGVRSPPVVRRGAGPGRDRRGPRLGRRSVPPGTLDGACHPRQCQPPTDVRRPRRRLRTGVHQARRSDGSRRRHRDRVRHQDGARRALRLCAACSAGVQRRTVPHPHLTGDAGSRQMVVRDLHLARRDPRGGFPAVRHRSVQRQHPVGAGDHPRPVDRRRRGQLRLHRGADPELVAHSGESSS
ncbi:disulfide bond formation protein DsbB [Gordonia sp. v-85]|nr:disulfide bond formation protein DsbB [Gordonia sp. v-85]